MRMLTLCMFFLLSFPCLLQAEESKIVIDENIQYKTGKGTKILHVYCDRFAPGMRVVEVYKDVDLWSLAKRICKKDLTEISIIEFTTKKIKKIEGGENHDN